MITAYDYHSTILGNQANIDCLLIGDSLGMTIQGKKILYLVSFMKQLHYIKLLVKCSK